MTRANAVIIREANLKLWIHGKNFRREERHTRDEFFCHEWVNDPVLRIQTVLIRLWILHSKSFRLRIYFWLMKQLQILCVCNKAASGLLVKQGCGSGSAFLYFSGSGSRCKNCNLIWKNSRFAKRTFLHFFMKRKKLYNCPIKRSCPAPPSDPERLFRIWPSQIIPDPTGLDPQQ